MNIGYKFEAIQKVQITHTQIVKYAGASGDFNPIHTVVPFANESGFKDVIVHGMLIKGFIGQAISQWIDVDKLGKLSTRFKAVTYPGETITVEGYVVDENESYWICEAVAINSVEEVKAKSVFEVKK